MPKCAAAVFGLVQLTCAYASGQTRGEARPSPLSVERAEVRVVARSAFSARASIEAGGQAPLPEERTCATRWKLWGTLAEDSGPPIPKAEVRAHLLSPIGEPTTPASPIPCAGSWPEVEVDSEGYRLRTDRVGAFCLSSCMGDGPVTVRITFAGQAYYTPASTEVRVEADRGMLALNFEPEPQIIDLDEPSVPISVRVLGLLESERARARVNLLDERGNAIGQLSLDRDGLSRGELSTDRLGGAGVGTIQALLVGEGLPPIPAALCQVVRRARVDLDLLRAKPEMIGNGMLISIAARWARGSVNAGTVEVLYRGGVIGAATLGPAGTADVLVDPDVDDPSGPVPIVVRYGSTAPFWSPGSPRTLHLSIGRGMGMRPLLLLLATLVLGAWILRSGFAQIWWQRKMQPRLAQIPVADPGLSARKGSVGRGIWSGRVVDAHDGAPVPGAMVTIVVPSFPRAHEDGVTAGTDSLDATLARTTTGPDGHFCLHIENAPPSTRLEVHAPWHSPLSQSLLGCVGVLLPMRSRKRSLLERFVDWTLRHASPPLSPHHDPTPGEVASTWQSRGSTHGTAPADVAAWARAVQAAAFGPAPVDEAAEERVNSLEPGRNR